MPCGPSADQVREPGRLSAAHGPPSLGLRWLGRPIAPRKRLDPETNRGSGAKDQQENDDPGHRWLLTSSQPCRLGVAPPGYQGALVTSLAPPGVRVSPAPPVTVVSLAGRRRPEAARRAGLEFVGKLLTVNLTSTGHDGAERQHASRPLTAKAEIRPASGADLAALVAVLGKRHWFTDRLMRQQRGSGVPAPSDRSLPLGMVGERGSHHVGCSPARPFQADEDAARPAL
jgi:hypothetical protein